MGSSQTKTEELTITNIKNITSLHTRDISYDISCERVAKNHEDGSSPPTQASRRLPKSHGISHVKSMSDQSTNEDIGVKLRDKKIIYFGTSNRIISNISVINNEFMKVNLTVGTITTNGKRKNSLWTFDIDVPMFLVKNNRDAYITIYPHNISPKKSNTVYNLSSSGHNDKITVNYCEKKVAQETRENISPKGMRSGNMMCLADGSIY